MFEAHGIEGLQAPANIVDIKIKIEDLLNLLVRSQIALKKHESGE